MSTLIAVAYPDVATAEQVRGELVQASKEHLLTLQDAVVAEHQADGKIKLHQGDEPGRRRRRRRRDVGRPDRAAVPGAAVRHGDQHRLGALAGKFADVGADDDFMKAIAGKNAATAHPDPARPQSRRTRPASSSASADPVRRRGTSRPRSTPSRRRDLRRGRVWARPPPPPSPLRRSRARRPLAAAAAPMPEPRADHRERGCGINNERRRSAGRVGDTLQLHAPARLPRQSAASLHLRRAISVGRDLLPAPHPQDACGSRRQGCVRRAQTASKDQFGRPQAPGPSARRWTSVAEVLMGEAREALGEQTGDRRGPKASRAMRADSEHEGRGRSSAG